MLSFRDTFELVDVCVATGRVDVQGLLEDVVYVGCEIRSCVADKGLVEVSLVVVCVATGCVDVKGLLDAVVSVGCEISGCVVDKGLADVFLVVVCEVIGCVGVEVPSDDVCSSAIFKINLFMNKKVKVQCVTAVDNS